MSGRKNTLKIMHLMIMILVIAVTMGAAQATAPSYAAEGSRAIEMVNNGAVSGIMGKQNSNIYFGNYKQSSDGNGGFKVEPIKWRVLQNADGRLFIMSDKLLDAVCYSRSDEGDTWDTCKLRAWYNNTFINTAFTDNEKDSVAITLVNNKDDNPQYDVDNGEDTEDKIFALSYTEVTDPNLGFNSDHSVKDSARKGDYTDYSEYMDSYGGSDLDDSSSLWLLRTKGWNGRNQVAIRPEGHIEGFSGLGNATNDKPVRPALKIDLGSVLFASAAVDGKQSGNMGPDAMIAPETYDGKDWKLTVKDKDRKFKVTETSATARINDTLTLNYNGAATGSDEYISAMIVDQAGKVLFYGRVARPASASGKVDIKIPKTLTKGTYDLQLFNEQYNGDKETDYASEMSNISLTVNNPLVPYVNDAGRKQEPKECTPVLEDTQTLSSGWCAVLDDVTMTTAITVKGNVDLILCDGATLGGPAIIKIDANSSLTIWAQSMGDEKGTIDASLEQYSSSSVGSCAGIRFDNDGTGKLTINGGNIIAKGFGGAAGIGGNSWMPGGNVRINGGKVIVKGSSNVYSSQGEGIGHGAANGSSGDLEFGKVKVSRVDSNDYVDSANRRTACRYSGIDILIQRCSNHKFEDGVCKYCGAGKPVRIDDGNSDLQVTLGKQLAYNGKEQTQTVTKITLNGTDITDCCDVSGNKQKNAGEYELTVKADPECDYEGTVKKKFTIKRLTPRFTVYANEVNDDLRISAAVLKRSDTTIPGKLALTETELLYGTNTYHWKFTPSDTTNYETVTGTVQIKVNGHKWKFNGFEWTGNESDGYTAVIAKYVCENDPGHEYTVSTVTLSDQETKPTCTEGGKTVYTATVAKANSLDDTDHTESKDAKPVDKLGHKWGAWTKLNEEQHRRVCEHDAAHTETEAHKWDDGVVTTESTVELNGIKTFTCTVCKAEKKELLPKLDPDDITPSDDNADDADEDEDLPVIDINKTNTVGNYKKRQMKIVFPANKKVDNYRVQYRLAGKKSWTNGWSAGTGTYIVKNLKKYSLCEFRIAGYVKLADGTWIRSKWSKISYRYVSSTPIKTIKAGKKCIKLTWKKEGKSNGYKIQYSLKKNMAGRKTITINGKSKTKYTIKKLKSGKTYYIKIRPIKKRSGKIYIGILSGTKKTKVK